MKTPDGYVLNDLLANIRTHIPDFDMATAIMKRLQPVNLVHTVYVSGDESNHIFSTQELAQAFADKQESPCVLSSYLIDNPERYYEVAQ